MVLKAVAVLTGSEGVTGTVTFTQDADGKDRKVVSNMFGPRSRYGCKAIRRFPFRTHPSHREDHRAETRSAWLPCSRTR